VFILDETFTNQISLYLHHEVNISTYDVVFWKVNINDDHVQL